MRKHGHDVLYNESQWKRWMKKRCLWNSIGGNGAPPYFPCIAEDRIGSDENGYAVYYTETDIRCMLEALTGQTVTTAHDTKV